MCRNAGRLIFCKASYYSRPLLLALHSALLDIAPQSQSLFALHNGRKIQDDFDASLPQPISYVEICDTDMEDL